MRDVWRTVWRNTSGCFFVEDVSAGTSFLLSTVVTQGKENRDAVIPPFFFPPLCASDFVELCQE